MAANACQSLSRVVCLSQDRDTEARAWAGRAQLQDLVDTLTGKFESGRSSSVSGRDVLGEHAHSQQQERLELATVRQPRLNTWSSRTWNALPGVKYSSWLGYMPRFTYGAANVRFHD